MLAFLLKKLSAGSLTILYILVTLLINDEDVDICKEKLDFGVCLEFNLRNLLYNPPKLPIILSRDVNKRQNKSVLRTLKALGAVVN